MILLINAEVKHREERENVSDTDDGVTVTAGLRLVARRVMDMFRSGQVGEEETLIREYYREHDSDHINTRSKRETYDGEYLLDTTEETLETEEKSQMLLSEALLTSAASGHKVRNIRQKIQEIGENSQLGGPGVEYWKKNFEF